MTRILLTGATGLVGGALALELLDRTDADLFCLVRGRDVPSARERLLAALEDSARGYGRPDLLPALRDRVSAVRGDITAASCGVASPLPKMDEVWHSAASLRYEEHHRAEITLQNLEGTRNTLALARSARADVFNHISTAYVAGRASGRVFEQAAPDASVANNCYEETKILGERLVAAEQGMHVRILRPSIVIGHSRTLHAASFSGLYGLARLSLFLRQTARRRLGVDPLSVPLSLRVDPLTELNLVPVDTVVSNAVAVASSGSQERYFHLTNDRTVSVATVVSVIHELLGLPAPRWASCNDELGAMDLAFDAGMGFYASYMRSTKLFDRTCTDAVCGPAASAVPLERSAVTAHVLHFLRLQQGFAPQVPGQRISLDTAVADVVG